MIGEVVFRSDMTVKLIDSMGSDELVVRAARVSTGTDTDANSGARRDAGLIRYLMQQRHGSPFEHNAFTFYIEAPIFVFREFQRHRIASYNEESGRYKKIKPVFYVPDRSRNSIQVGKPGHYTFIEGTDFQHQTVVDSLASTSIDAYGKYERMLTLGIAREVARQALPLNIYSSMYVTMNARGLMNFLSLRVGREDATFTSYPQREIEMVAEQMETLWAEKMPITYNAFRDAGWVCP